MVAVDLDHPIDKQTNGIPSPIVSIPVAEHDAVLERTNAAGSTDLEFAFSIQTVRVAIGGNTIHWTGKLRNRFIPEWRSSVWSRDNLTRQAFSKTTGFGELSKPNHPAESSSRIIQPNHPAIIQPNHPAESSSRIIQPNHPAEHVRPNLKASPILKVTSRPLRDRFLPRSPLRYRHPCRVSPDPLCDPAGPERHWRDLLPPRASAG